MSILGEVLGGSVPHTFTHKGTSYKVGLITQAVKLGYERRLFAKAKEAAVSDRHLMSKEEWHDYLTKLNDDYIRGEYAFESKRGLEALQTPHGILILSSLLFDTDEVTIMKLINERKEEVVALIQLLIHESFPEPEHLEEETTDDPNVREPELVGK